MHDGVLIQITLYGDLTIEPSFCGQDASVDCILTYEYQHDHGHSGQCIHARVISLSPDPYHLLPDGVYN
jgi:hypothetical protein